MYFQKFRDKKLILKPVIDLYTITKSLLKVMINVPLVYFSKRYQQPNRTNNPAVCYYVFFGYINNTICYN